MIQHIFAKFLIVLVISCCTVIPSVDAAFPQDTDYRTISERLSRFTEGNDQLFVDTVHFYVLEHYTYRTLTGDAAWDVQSPDRFWRSGVGDCSELALLEAAMLSPRIDARVVTGYNRGGYPHDTVELHMNGYVKYIDQGTGFVKLHDGLDANERVVI